jgi:hypothetical protein
MDAPPPRLASVGRSFILDYDDTISPATLDLLESCLVEFLLGTKSARDASQLFKSTIGTTKPFDRISAILQTPESPIPDFSACAHFMSSSRKKTRSWTEYENQRLLAGIHRFGIDDWQSVAAFVGNGRTRAQCSQRWIRGLDPRICKDRWTFEDDQKLEELVNCYGTRNWTKVAGEMGNRSDVQCRYHYKQMKQCRSVKTANAPAGISGSMSLPLHLLVSNPAGKGEKVVLPPIEDLMSHKAFRQSGSMGVLPKLNDPKLT